jgi:hypothetical protein
MFLCHDLEEMVRVGEVVKLRTNSAQATSVDMRPNKSRFHRRSQPIPQIVHGLDLFR